MWPNDGARDDLLVGSKTRKRRPGARRASAARLACALSLALGPSYPSSRGVGHDLWTLSMSRGCASIIINFAALPRRRSFSAGVLSSGMPPQLAIRQPQRQSGSFSPSPHGRPYPPARRLETVSLQDMIREEQDCLRYAIAVYRSAMSIYQLYKSLSLQIKDSRRLHTLQPRRLEKRHLHVSLRLGSA